MAKEKIKKVKTAKKYTRMQALRALSDGTRKPEDFLDMSDPFRRVDVKNPGTCRNHNNFHVRRTCWKMLGSPVLDNPEEHAKFLASLHIKEKVVEVVGDGHTDDSVAVQAQFESAMTANPAADTP